MLAVQISALLTNAGFRLRMTECSHEEILEVFVEFEMARSTKEIGNFTSVAERAFLMEWNAADDKFQFTLISQVKPRNHRVCYQWSHQFSAHWGWFRISFCMVKRCCNSHFAKGHTATSQSEERN